MTPKKNAITRAIWPDIVLRPYQQVAVDDTWRQCLSSQDPCLLVASVGAGKTFMIAEMHKRAEDLGMRALNLSMSSELIEQNSDDYKVYTKGRQASVMCAKLGRKETKASNIFATPATLWSAIQKGHPVSKIRFKLITVDEAHNINENDARSMYMKIIEHYRTLEPDLRIVGLTGTPYRGKGHKIYGDKKFFRHKTADIDTVWLINNGFLVRPVFGSTHYDDNYDFSDLEIQANGKFKGADLARCSEGKGRKTAKIVADIVRRTKDRGSVMIFASTAKHCEEVMETLPAGEAVMVTGNTPDGQRYDMVKQVKAGEKKYLVVVNCLLTGFNAPVIDTVAFMRPTESIVLWLQAIGRGLRLLEGKEDCLVLDYAGNLDRLGDVDSPILCDALSLTSEVEKDVPCPACETLNTVNARRCIGFDHGTGHRCDFFFSWVDCPHCETKNDATARNCRHCGGELIDPNEKLEVTPSKRIGVTPVPLKVLSMVMSKHRKKSKKGVEEMLKISFMLDTDVKAHQFIDVYSKPDGNSYERRRFINTVAKRYFPHSPAAVNASLDEILQHADRAVTPTTLLVYRKVNSKYLEIADVRFD